MKRIVLLTFSMLLMTWIRPFAQTITNTAVLRSASTQVAQEESTNYARVLALSKTKGWPLTIKGKNGRLAVLRGVDAHGSPLYTTTFDNIISAATIGTSQLWPGGSTGLNLNGSSSSVTGKIAIWDEAKPLQTHVELTGRVTIKDNASSVSNHSTHVAGTMIASGVNPLAKGMANGTQSLLAYDYNNDNSEMLAAASSLLVSNHSYGSIAGWYYDSDLSRWEFWGNYGDTADYKFGYYSSDAQMWDSIAFNAPNYLICVAAGNNRGETGPDVGSNYWRYNANGVMYNAGKRPAGISSNDAYDCIPTAAVAKNILTVGAVNPIPGGYSGVSDVVMSDFSSWGPADDGRIKPDVVADGVNVLSSVGSGNSAYDTYSGTSMATPSVTGSSLLLQEYYAKLHSGSFMRSATLKGLLIHTADEAGAADGPDFIYGWGLVNTKKAAAVITSDTSVTNRDQMILERTLTNTTSDSIYTIAVVASGKGALTATICWTDPPGAVSTTNLLNNRSKKLINDLDIRITKGSSTWYPYVLDYTIPWNPATTGDDTLNNVEKIVLTNVVPGQTYTIKVRHKGTLARGTQAYSLLISGVNGSAYCTSAPTGSTGTRIDKVTIANIANTNASGCTTYSDFTSLTANVQPNQALPFSVQLSSCDASTNSRVVKIFMDYTSSGNFVQVASSGVLTGGTTTWSGSFTTPGTLTIGNFGIMRIVAEETTDTSAVLACGSYATGETQDYAVKFVAPTNDVGVTAILNPSGSACAADSQLVTVTIKNFGSVTQSNIKVTTIVNDGSSDVATLTGTYPDSITAGSSVTYTLQSGFNSKSSTTYTMRSFTTLAADQLASDDTSTASLVISAATASPSGSAELCGTDKVYLKATTGSGDVAFWYTDASSTTPIATGADTSTTTITSNKTYYLGLNDGIMSVGPKTKLAYTSGGYNNYSYNFINFTNSVPVTIESARLYIGYPGKITFVVADMSNFDTAAGSYNISVISSTTIDAYATTPTPTAGAVSGNNASDTGAVFYLGLSVPTAGNHIIYIVSDANATIFRNNSITSNPYPYTIPGVFSITSNSAVTTANPTLYQQYYYFLYDVRIKTTDCPSARVPIVASSGTAPVITLNGNVLTSTAASTYQWYVNGTAVDGATLQTDTAVVTGTYTVVATDSYGCTQTSNAVTYSSGRGGAISLAAYPNPSKGVFQVNFVTNTTDQVDLLLLNMLGQEVYHKSYGNFSGVFSQQVNASNLADGVYTLKVVIGKDSYVQKLLIVR